MDNRYTSFTTQDAVSYFETRDQQIKDGFDIMNPGGQSGKNGFSFDTIDLGGGGDSTTTPSVNPGIDTSDTDRDFGGDETSQKDLEEEAIENYYKSLQEQEEKKKTSKVLLYAAIALGIYSIIK